MADSAVVISNDSKGNPSLYLVIGPADKKGFLPVRDMRGNESKLAESKIEEKLPGSFPSVGDFSARATDIIAEAETMMPEIDIKEVWDLIYGEQSSCTTDFLTELITEDRRASAIYAVYLSLFRDGVYFKRVKNVWEVRNESAVKEMLVSRSRMLEKVKIRRELTELFQSSFAPGVDIDNIRLKVSSEVYRSWYSRIRQLAIARDPSSFNEEFLDFMDELAHKCSLKGLPHQVAFSLLRHIGAFDEHENLDLLKYDIRRDFPEDLFFELPELTFEDCTDLTNLYTVTIDDAKTRDIDDALSISTDDDGFIVHIHIADPGFYVKPGTPLDSIAMKRGTSVYLPDMVINMLPSILSEYVGSLIQGEKRRAMTFKVRVDNEGNIKDFNIFSSVVSVDRRMTYEEVDEQIGDEIFSIYHKMALLRKSYREKQGAFSVNLPELDIHVEESGEITVLLKNEETPSHLVVSECMIIANNVAGEYCRRNSIPAIYRVQGPPTSPIKEVNTIAQQFAALKNIRRGEYSVHPGPHCGLGIGVYVQASSPLRRYGDLLAHRQIMTHLSGGSLLTIEEVTKIHGTVDAAVSAASITEKNSENYWLFEYIRRNLPFSVECTVLDVFPEGTRGLIYINKLAMRQTVSFAKSVTPGDVVQFTVKACDPRREYMNMTHDKELS
ncbi:RNB domain-containing ribonuclease [Myxococcota bacterium]|nr:RNB domain-containing ribonuclease [Myxococcota bacterium]MBU1381206.1 RNB domain-containing ribonuclease [Myxococcota bacterium]MBU1495628.1 RNB domain-containing ribonuclease [Myxococcota bacterium]